MIVPFLRLAILASLAALPLLASPVIEQVNVYTTGRDGYHTYRIPAVIRAANVTLLAFC